MIDSRDIKDLNPIVMVLTERFMAIAKAKGLKIGISNTLRDIEKQDALYTQGRTTAGAVVTSVKGGYSYHNWGLAVDIVPLDSAGQLSWPENTPLWTQLGEIGESLGMEWGGRWTSPVDRPHYQVTFGYTCSAFVNGTAVPQSIKAGCKDTALVKTIQRLLGITADGVFGSETENAVKAFGATNGEINAEVLSNLFKTDTEVNIMRYNTIEDIPVWAKATINKLVEKSYIAGNGTSLDLSEDMLRMFVINDRAGIYDK